MTVEYFTDHLTNRLLKLDATTWRSIRAEVRWCYMRWRLDSPPQLLRSYIATLPEDSLIWCDYAAEITRKRRGTTLAVRRMNQKREKLRVKAMKREYQRSYMKDYRAGKKRRAK